MALTAVILLLLASGSQANVILSNPTPYGKSTLFSSQILPDGSNFPCMLRDGTYDLEGVSNTYSQGSTQQLSFTGNGLGGGGSCQLSLTTDLQPDDNSVWRVIQSIEGGCPIKGDAVDSTQPSTYSYTIPKQLPAGKYSLAWTWFNKDGISSMFMNCAPLTVTGDAGDQDYLGGLPLMLVADIGSSCTTLQDRDVQFPHPGESLEHLGGDSGDLALPVGSACSPSLPTAPSSTAAAPPPKHPSKVPPPPPSPPPAPTSSQGGIYISDPVPPTTTAAGVKPTQGSSSNTFPAQSSCTPEGTWNCIDGSSFQRCASGVWSVVENLAVGISCKMGQSSELQIILHEER